MLEVLLERLTLDTSRTIFRKCYISQYYLKHCMGKIPERSSL